MTHIINIRRIDNKTNRTFAWLVQVQRNNHIVMKMFTDAVYGGKRKALQAAVCYREQLLAEVNPFEHQLWRRAILRRNNTSGITGVSRHDKIVNPKIGSRRVFWLSSWVNEHGATRQRKFSVMLYGELEAKQLAIAERERQLKRVCAAKCV